MSDDQESDWTRGAAVLRYQHCARCGHRWYLPRPRCGSCGNPAPLRRAAAGAGTVLAVTTVHRAPSGGHHPPAPFGICLVELDEAVRVLGRCDPRVAVRDRVTVSFPDAVPHFERA
jgi:uncharacterized OB-fold protein